MARRDEKKRKTITLEEWRGLPLRTRFCAEANKDFVVIDEEGSEMKELPSFEPTEEFRAFERRLLQENLPPAELDAKLEAYREWLRILVERRALERTP